MTQDSEDPAADAQINAADSLTYWNGISPDVNGMLGGYPQISRIDLQGSKNFITKVSRLYHPRPTRSSGTMTDHNPPPAPKRLKLAVDCGAGIGRITEGCLTHICERVDIVEPVEKFAHVLTDGPLEKEGKVGDVYITSLESWDPQTHKRYDLIWNQWCLGHLTDAQLVTYFKRASRALAENGWIGVKENMSTRDDASDIFDELDSSVTRSNEKFKTLFEQAGLKVVRTELQTGFPKGLGLYPVRMYALRPVQEKDSGRKI